MLWLFAGLGTLGGVACTSTPDIRPNGTGSADGTGGNGAGPDGGAAAGGGTACAGETTRCASAAECVTKNAVAHTKCAGGVCDGNGACVGCVTVDDCAATGALCTARTCTGNVCGVRDAERGTACTTDDGWVCNGTGTCVACNVAGDCRPQSSACLVNTCSANVCGNMNASEGTSCSEGSGVVCNASSACVQCNATSDCAGMSACMANVCVEPICSDGVQDGDETGIDCGGYCLPCPNADGCTLASDCESGDCKNLVCVTCAADADCPAGDFCDLTNQGGTCTAP